MTVILGHRADLLRWAYREGWRCADPPARRLRIFRWIDPDGRVVVEFTTTSRTLKIFQHYPHVTIGDGWANIVTAGITHWQHAIDILTAYWLIPARFNRAYQDGVADTTGLTLTRERLRTLQHADLLTWLAAIDHSLRNGGRMTGANLALRLLCDAAGVNRDSLDFDPHWVASQRTLNAIRREA